MAGPGIDARGVNPDDQRAHAYRVFAQALEYQGTLRERYLTLECGADLELRREVEVLLQLAVQDETSTRALLALPERRQEDLVAQIFGRFRLVELIGEGGMGVVYRAERTDGVPQSVAVKLLARTVDAATQVRFERELRLLAGLEHAAVARLIDAGIDHGRAWIAMEFVRGERIDAYCRARDLSAVQIVALLVQLADAIGAAHRMLVVHSDIKPANVLVTPDGAPKLIDFGIAATLRETSEPDSLSAGRQFSPGFAAPEQINGEAITVATDVYGLGALGYLLLTGQPPFPDAVQPWDYMRAITERPADLASVALLAASSDAARARPLRGDLDAIFAKALQREAAQRYPSAADMRADLLRFLEHRPVRARISSPAYRAGKFIRRHTLSVSLSTLLLLSIIAGGLFAGVQAHHAALARDAARAVTAFLTNDILAAANPMIAGTRDVQLRPLLDSATSKLQQRFEAQPIVLAELQAAMGSGYAALFDTDKAESLLTEAERGLARELGDANPETQNARMALWYLYVGNIDIGKLLKLSQRIAAAEKAAGRAESPLSLRARLMIDWIPCVAKAAAVVGLSNCGDVVRPFYLDARARFGPDALTTQEMAWFLGVALMYSARENEAEPVLRDACAGLQHYYGPIHHRLTACRRYLAKALDANGKSAEAAALLEVAVRNFDKTLGPDSHFTAVSELELGTALLHAGQPAQALIAARKAVSAMQASAGDDSKDVWLAQLLLADVLVQSNQSQEGLELGEQALAHSVQTLGADPVTVLRLRDQLSEIYLHAGKQERAEVLSRENLSFGAQLSNRPGWFVGQLETSLANALIAEHRDAEAESLLQDAVARLNRELGAGNHRTLLAESALAANRQML